MTKNILKKVYQKTGLSKLDKVFYLLKKSFYFAWHRHHFLIPPKTMLKYLKSFMIVLKRNNGNTSNLFINQKSYLKWIETNEQSPVYKKFKYNPLISIIIPTYNVSRKLLSECLDSILMQSYTNFEICIADDNSSNEETIETLKEYSKKDKRIKVTYRKENGMISKASNTAIEMAKGEFITLVDNDDIISKDALYYAVEVLNNNKDTDMIYSDEDKLDFNGKRCEPHFKPDWSPDTFLGLNYICHLTFLRKSIVDKIGGFRSEFDGSQDYDLFLRFTEVTDKIYHIDKILYHWRQSATSTAGYLGNKSYAYIAGKKALEEALKRRNIDGEVLDNPRVSSYLIKYKHNNPLVSIIIPTRDHSKILKRCIDSLYKKTDYKNFEIIIVDNGSVEPDTKELLESYMKEHDNFKVIRIDSEFNYSYLNNEGVKAAKGEYILLLNNDTEVIDKNWLDDMVGYASQKHVGAVGIKLLFADKKVQHAGVVLGYGGPAGHIYVTCSKDDNGLFGRLAMPYNYSAVTAACLLVSKDKYNSVNGLDESLKVAYNDTDFNLKLLEKGYYNVLLPHITMYHYESRSRGYEVTKSKIDRLEKERDIMRKKWGEKLTKDKYFSINNF
jgi:glycosyltransferase involved in cell wall biosynthesis